MLKILKSLIVCVISSLPLLNAKCADATYEACLLKDLLRSYDPAVRPVSALSKPLTVKLSLSLIQIQDLDERRQILTTNLWIEQEWVDPRIKWDPSKYGAVDKLRIPTERIWVPDVVLYNNADEFEAGIPKTKVTASSNGRVYLTQLLQQRSTCPIDVRYFPLDDQTCILKYGLWAYSQFQVDLIRAYNRTPDLSRYVESGEWDLMSFEVTRHVEYYPQTPNDPFPDLRFKMKIRRRALPFFYNVILPCTWITILSLLVFWLPPNSECKVSLGVTGLFSFTIFVMLIYESIPPSSSIPLMVIYLTGVMSFTAISIIIQIILSRIHWASFYSPVMSKRFYIFMTRRVATVLRMTATVKRYESARLNAYKRSLSRTSIEKHELERRQFDRRGSRKKKISNYLLCIAHIKDVKKEKDNINVVNEWRLVAFILDRFFFWLMLLIAACSMIYMFVIYPLLKPHLHE